MSDFCRLCGIVKDLYELSEIDDSELLLEFKLKSCFNISLTFDKLMPQNVCSECIQCLEKSFVFHQNILNVQDDLVQNMKHNVKKQILDCNIECVVLLEQIPISLMRRSTRKIEEISKIENTIQIKRTIPIKVKKVKFSIPAQKRISSTNKTVELSVQKDSCMIKESRRITMQEIYKMELNGIFERTPKTFDGNEDITNSIVWSNYIWKCNKCDLQFNEITLMEQHHFESHPNQTLQYCCFSCPKVNLKRHSILNHVSTHQPPLRFCCMYCSKYHTSFIDLYHHYVQNHPNSNIFLCFYCGILSENGSYAKTHRKMHFKNADYSCDLCGKNVKSVTSIKQHIETMHINDLSMKYTCEICGVAFKNKGNLRDHQFIHDTNHVFGCNICEKKFATMSKLRKHNKMHLKTKDEICPVCGRGFSRKSVLKNHQKTHEDKYDYECEFCDKKYKFAHSLKVHRYTHTGEKPYSCLDDNCTMRFTNWPNFNKHMKTLHGRDMSKRKKLREQEDLYFAKPTNSVLNNIYS